MNAKTNKKSNKKEKTKMPDVLGDAVWAVNDYDDVRLKRREIKGETLESLHKKAVRLIVLCNNIKGAGCISISKARSISSSLYRESKITKMMETLKCERSEAMAKLAEKKAA